MALVLPADWRPSGIDNLEPQAWRALQHPGSTSVVAGPGAGKTEFLAQRAVYLLQTGLCPRPRRILAISFKSDAADNLAARVRQRCPPELAGRFVSLTFDSFTKGLVDRFLTALPAPWQPTQPYEIAFPTRPQVRGFLDSARDAAPGAWRGEVAGLGLNDFESRHVGSLRLPLGLSQPRSGVEFAVYQWWQAQLRATPSRLTFVNLNRLAELLLRANPHILRALRATYPFVFVDEFQDTTHAQYDFLLSAFSGAQTTVTVVGDDKQRIMAWAGARTDAFARFEQDFAATRIALQFNFRSSPELVRIQHVVAQALDPNFVPTIAQAPRQIDGDAAQVWASATKEEEAEHLARWLTEDMARRNKQPRDYVILVRQRSEDYENELADALGAAGLFIRNESRMLGRTSLQDLLTDEFCAITIALLRLATLRRDPEAWALASEALDALRGADQDEDAGQRVSAELSAFLNGLRETMRRLPPSPENAHALVEHVLAFLTIPALRRTYLEYTAGDLLTIMVDGVRLHLATCATGAANWAACLEVFLGLNQLPLMTVHKSKGLEYDTIVFVGLDDQAWWSHTPENPEGIATFFVALSRAKQRAIFSFCQERGRRARVADLYQLLTNAGVLEITL